jgi:uncharacterized protein YkwD
MRTSPSLVVSLAVSALLFSFAGADQDVQAESPAPAPAAAEAPRAPEVKATAEELAFVDLVNQERARRGLSQLELDTTLIVAARKHSDEMREKKYFNHHSPTSGIKTPMDRYLRELSARPSYACVGENLFYCSIVDVQRGHTAFMNSPTHRENVLFPRFEKIGVGVVKNERGEFWVTQMYLASTDPLLASRKTTAKK